jgi:integrase/recombinase XerC
MHRLIESFSQYLRVERMRGATTITRYVDVIDALERFLASEPGAPVTFEAAGKLQLTAFLRAESAFSGAPSRSVWNQELSALRSFYGYLFKQELVTVNPAHKIDFLKTRSKERVPVSFDDYLALVDAAEASSKAYRARNVALTQVFFHCGLRVSEVASLDVEQLDLERRVLTNVRRKGDKFLSAPISDLVAEALERYLPERERFPSASALFLSDRGRRMSVRAVQDVIRSLGERAGLQRSVSPHVLRHGSATELAELGTKLEVIQEHLGHESVLTTRRYVHTKDAARRAAVDALGARAARARRSARNHPQSAQAVPDSKDSARN